MMRSIHDTATVLPSLAPKAHTATANGTAIDTVTRQSDIHAFYINVGTWTAGTHLIEFQESADNSAWSDIPKERLDGFDFDDNQVLESNLESFSIANATKNDKTYLIGYIGAARYLRAKVTVTNGGAGAVYAVSLVQAKFRSTGQNPSRSSGAF